MKRHPVMSALLAGRFSMLLGSLVLAFLVLPILPGERLFLDRLINLFGLLVLVSCLRAVVVDRRYLIFLVLLSMLNVSVGGAELFHRGASAGLVTLALVGKLIYFVLIFVSIIGGVLKSRRVTGDTICGAISAYALLGIIWAIIYALFYHLDPESFSFSGGAPENAMGAWSYYFSFVTLTTVGYGDVTPQTTGAQFYALLEAVTGQLFLAILVARLVALHIVQGAEEEGASSR
jgi:hypothetical protein